MSVYQRGRRWWAYVVDQKTNKKIRWSAGSTREEAERAEAQTLLELKAGRVPVVALKGSQTTKVADSTGASNCATISDLLDLVEKRVWSKCRTAKEYKLRVGVLKEVCGSRKLDKPVALDEVWGWVEKLKQGRQHPGKKPPQLSTVRAYVVLLQQAFGLGYDWEKLPWTVKLKTVLQQLPKPNARSFIVSDSLEVDILKSLDRFAACAIKETRKTRIYRARGDAKDLVTCLIDTGCRVGELATLTWDRVDFDGGTIAIPAGLSKSGKAGVVGVSPRMRQVLLHRRDTLKLPQAFALTKSHLKTIRRWLREDLGITDSEFCLHALRHTHGTRLYEATGDIRLVQRSLRHSQLQTTVRYEHLASNTPATVIEALEKRRVAVS
jgi:integrase